jgi:hypothetical protein
MMRLEMDSIFRAPWDDLELDDVADFVEGASGEGLVWEAKGTDPLRALRGKIISAVCGFANQIGGFVIVGAASVGERWELPGVENDCGEDPHDWLARILTANLTRVPPFEVKRWTVDNDRVVAVIRVDESATPPCMTKDGLVWQRVVGETLKVTNPEILLDLIGKGQAARHNAERRALNALTLVHHGHELVGERNDGRFALAMAPVTGPTRDYSARLFKEPLKEALVGAMRGLEISGFRVPDAIPAPHRDGYVLRRGTRADWQWGLQATWNGTVVVELASPRGEEGRNPPSVDRIIAQAWKAAAAPLAELVGIPDKQHVPTHLAIRMADGHFQLATDQGYVTVSPGGRPIQRWTTMAEPAEEELESINRELARSAGLDVVEPG